MRSVSHWPPEPATDAKRNGIPSAARAIGMSKIEWQVLVTLHPNVLFEGSRAVIEPVLRVVETYLTRPALYWRASAHAALPHQHSGSLVLFEIGMLDAGRQDVLFDWLSQAEGRVHVVSTSATPVYAYVKDGAFRADLYYRLSALRVSAAR